LDLYSQTLHPVNVLGHFTLKNGSSNIRVIKRRIMVPLKSELIVIQSHWKWRHSTDHTWLSISYCNYSYIVYHLSYLTLKIRNLGLGINVMGKWHIP